MRHLGLISQHLCLRPSPTRADKIRIFCRRLSARIGVSQRTSLTKIYISPL